MLIVEYSCFEIHSLASVSLLCFLRIQKESIPWYKKYIVVTVWNVWYSINKYQTILKIEKYMSDCFTFFYVDVITDTYKTCSDCLWYWAEQNLILLSPQTEFHSQHYTWIIIEGNVTIIACSKHCMEAQKGLTGWQNNIEWNTAQVTIVDVFNCTD